LANKWVNSYRYATGASSGYGVQKMSTVKMGLGNDGKASVYVVATEHSTPTGKDAGTKRTQLGSTSPDATIDPRSVQKAQRRSLMEYEAGGGGLYGC
jgi:hypothetical protein